MTQLRNIILISAVFFLTGCGVYSFTGASVPPEAKTVSIGFFTNKAKLVEPTLSPTFTNTLRDQFITQLNLNMVDRGGDLDLQGEITDYKTTPVAIQGDQTSALNRLTVTVKVKFTNKYEPDKDFEQSFTEFADYSSDRDFNSVKSELIELISNALSDDIFNKCVVNW